jgi:hypothetical protein
MMPKGSYQAHSSPFGPDDWAIATRELQAAIHGTTGAITIGRSVQRNLRLLSLRYGSSRKIVVLWQGSPGRAVSLERALQRHACGRYPSRVANQRIGGGRRAPDGPHVVYVVVWDADVPSGPLFEDVTGRRRRVRKTRRISACSVPRRTRR